jgi:hypothetical protein
MGLQIYSRAAGGVPVFETFFWHHRYASRFAGDAMEDVGEIDARTFFTDTRDPQ